MKPNKTTAKKNGLLHLSSLYGRHQSRDQKRSLHGYLKPQPTRRFKLTSSTTFPKVSFTTFPLYTRPFFLSSFLLFSLQIILLSFSSFRHFPPPFLSSCLFPSLFLTFSAFLFLSLAFLTFSLFPSSFLFLLAFSHP